MIRNQPCADGDDLVYAMLFSIDNGTSHTTSKIDYDNTTIVLNSSNLPSCDPCRIKILATDGINTNSSISDKFIIENNPQDKFYIQNLSGSNVVWLGSKGNIFLKGTCSNPTVCTNPPQNSFKIKDNLGNVKAYIDMQGNMCIGSNCQNSDEQSNCSSPNPSFIIQNSTGGEVIVIDRTNGNLCSTGRIYENQNEIP